MVAIWHCASKKVDSRHAKHSALVRQWHFKVKWLGRHYLGEARHANYSNAQRSHLSGLSYPISTVRSEGWVNKCAPIGLAYRAPSHQSDFVNVSLILMHCLFVVNLFLTTAPYLWSRLMKRKKSTDMLKQFPKMLHERQMHSSRSHWTHSSGQEKCLSAISHANVFVFLQVLQDCALKSEVAAG